MSPVLPEGWSLWGGRQLNQLVVNMFEDTSQALLSRTLYRAFDQRVFNWVTHSCTDQDNYLHPHIKWQHSQTTPPCSRNSHWGELHTQRLHKKFKKTLEFKEHGVQFSARLWLIGSTRKQPSHHITGDHTAVPHPLLTSSQNTQGKRSSVSTVSPFPLYSLPHCEMLNNMQSIHLMASIFQGWKVDLNPVLSVFCSLSSPARHPLFPPLPPCRSTSLLFYVFLRLTAYFSMHDVFSRSPKFLHLLQYLPSALFRVWTLDRLLRRKETRGEGEPNTKSLCVRESEGETLREREETVRERRQR